MIAVPTRTRSVAAAIAVIGTTASRVMRVSAIQTDSKPAVSAFRASLTISGISGAPRKASPTRSMAAVTEVDTVTTDWHAHRRPRGRRPLRRGRHGRHPARLVGRAEAGAGLADRAARGARARGRHRRRRQPDRSLGGTLRKADRGRL